MDHWFPVDTNVFNLKNVSNAGHRWAIGGSSVEFFWIWNTCFLFETPNFVENPQNWNSYVFVIVILGTFIAQSSFDDAFRYRLSWIWLKNEPTTCTDSRKLKLRTIKKLNKGSCLLLKITRRERLKWTPRIKLKKSKDLLYFGYNVKRLDIAC